MDASGKDARPEQALWRDLTSADGEQAFGRAWLSLLCQGLPGAAAAVLVLSRPGGETLHPAARYPAAAPLDAGLLDAAGHAATERRGVMRAGPPLRLAYPILLNDALTGAVALELAPAAGRDPAKAMRHVQWAVAWVRDFLRRRTVDTEAERASRLGLALDLLAAALEEERFSAACRVAATELATRLGCMRVSFGLLRHGQSEVQSISHSASFGRRMDLTRLLAETMDEAIDQRAVLLYPPADEDDTLLVRAHGALAAGHGAEQILTVPMSVKDRFLGAVVFERDGTAPFDQNTVDLAEAVVSILGPSLSDKRDNDRWLAVKIADAASAQARALFGPRHPWRKLVAFALLATAAACSLATGPYRITADGKVEGAIQRSVVAPFDGYISEAPVKAGTVVEAGQLLAAMDDRDLVLDRLRWVTERQQHRLEYDKALSASERADTLRFKNQLDEADAQVRLVDAELTRSRMTSPFHGLVVSGDLTQSIGAAMHRGDVLFEIAPLEDYRVQLAVLESQIADVVPGQAGKLVVSALPNESFPFTVERVTPIAGAKDGQTVFTVDARLDSTSERLRPGMGGVGKIDVGIRNWSWILFRPLLHWLRVSTWRWLP